MRRLLLGLVPIAIVFACGSESPPIEDTSADASATDGAGGPDGTSAAPLPPSDGGKPDAPAGPFCASLNPAPKLCEDFEDGTPPAGSDTQIDSGAQCGIDQGAYACATPAGVSSVTNALLRTPLAFDASAKRFVVSFAFRPDAAPPASGTLVIARAFVGSAHAVSIELASQDGPVLREQEGAPPWLETHSGQLSAMPAPGTWTRFELAIDLAGKTATLKANGAPIAAMALTGTQYDLFALNLGVQADGPFSARFDDVVMSWSP